MSSGPSTIKSSRVLACVLCQHRKIKCDRNSPCSNCIKANVTCTPSTPAPARKRRRPNQDLQERLARCEELLKSYASGNADTPMSSTSEPKETPPPHDPLPTWLSPGKVVVENGSTRFMDSYLWNSVHEELSAMRKIVDADDGDDASILTSEAASPDDTSDLILCDYAKLSLEDVQPSPIHVFRMWQIFVERVNPLSKVIHVPSIQPFVVEAAASTQNIPPNYQPLLFAIFNISVVAMTEAECRQVLGMTKDAAQKQFSAGVRAALVQVNFMKQYDLVILQALTLYLLSLQGRYNRHAAWIFSGVCVRIAQKMGLHRDGELLHLTPFETEMRRRVWWQIVQQDAKYAMLSGLGYSLIPSNWDTKMPSNLNDADLFPGSTEPVPEREGPTEMGFCLLGYTMGKFVTKCHGLPGFEAAVLGSGLDETQPQTPEAAEGLDLSSSKYRELIDSFEAEVREIEEKYLDPTAGPSQYVASQLPRLILSKLHDFMVPIRDLPEFGTEVFNSKDNLFRIGVAGVENNLESYEILAKRGFLWYCKLHFQHEVFAVMVGALVQRPKGTLADRAWRAIDGLYQYHDEMLDISQKSYMTLAVFVLKAWKNRAQALAELGRPVEVPAVVQELMKRMPAFRDGQSADIASTPASSTGSSAGQPASKETGQQDPAVEQFLGGYLDITPLDWDMWGNMGGGSSSQGPPGPGGFGSFGGIGGIGPSGTW